MWWYNNGYCHKVADKAYKVIWNPNSKVLVGATHAQLNDCEKGGPINDAAAIIRVNNVDYMIMDTKGKR